MRLAPIPMFFSNHVNTAVHFAELSSKTTHASEDCIACFRYFANVIWKALNSERNKDARMINKQVLPSSRINIVNGEFRSAREQSYYGSGYVVATLEAALWAFWTTDDFSEAVLKAVNLGGDADTTAAVCGQLAGAFYGASDIPTAWLKKLAMADDIRNMATALHNADATKAS